MTSDRDDLEQALQENLKLRRELGDQVAKAKQGGGFAYRLGWVLYWFCLGLIGLYAVGGLATQGLEGSVNHSSLA
jgi:hypothetical protein